MKNRRKFVTAQMKSLSSFFPLHGGSPKIYKFRPFLSRRKTFLRHSVAQSAPDTRHKLHKWEEGPQTPQWDRLSLAFKVFNNWGEEAESQNQAKHQTLATAIQGSQKIQAPSQGQQL